MEYIDPLQPISVVTCINNDVKVLLTIDEVYEYVDISKFKNYVEYELNDIIDTLFIQALKSVPESINYYIAGGKALNTIIKNKFSPKSFDFDIHVSRDEEIIQLQRHIITSINNELGQHYRKYPRYCIFKSLEKLGIVDESLLDYYLNDNLFYYGHRSLDRTREINNIINGVFLKLKFLKRNRYNKTILRMHNTPYNFTNYRDQPFIEADHIMSSAHNTDAKINRMYALLENTNQGSDFNVYYYPLSDIGLDSTVNFGVQLYRSLNPDNSIFINRLYGIKYAGYILLLYNLIRYIKVSKYKWMNNYKRLKLLTVNPEKIKCNFYLHYTRNNLENDIINLTAQINTADQNIPIIATSVGQRRQLLIKITNYINAHPIRLKVSNPAIKNRLYGDNADTITPADMIVKFANHYIGYRQHTCSRVIFGPASTPLDHLEFFLDNEIVGNNLLSDIIFDMDDTGYVYHYTGDLYRSLNTFVSYQYNNIATDNITRYHRPDPDQIDLNGRQKSVPEFNVGIAEYANVCENIDNVFRMYHLNHNLADFKININDNFTVYSCQLVYSFNSLTHRKIDVDMLKSGDIIMLQQYLSSTYNHQTNLDYFLEGATVIYKIKINKNSHNWIFLGNYSYYKNEKEILLKRGSYLVYEKTLNELVKFKENNVEMTVIYLSLFDNEGDSLLYSKQISGTLDYYENPLLSQYYIELLESANDRYFTKRYAHADKLNCDMDKLNRTAPNNYEFLYESDQEYIAPDGTRTLRPNHGLAHAIRVSAWVYIYCLTILKHNYNPIWVGLINPVFILKVCIASIFLVAGRESEQGYLEHPTFEQFCRFRSGNSVENGETINDYKHAYTRYHEKSARYFRETVAPLNLYTPDELDTFYNIMIDFYNPYRFPEGKDRLIAFLFENAHAMDLVRVVPYLQNYIIPVNRHTNMEIFNEENMKFVKLSIEMCKLMGDNVVAHEYKEFTEDTINQLAPDLSQNMQPRFVKFNNNPRYCVAHLLNFLEPEIKYIIDDIIDNTSVFIQPNPEVQLNNLVRHDSEQMIYPVNAVNHVNVRNPDDRDDTNTRQLIGGEVRSFEDDYLDDLDRIDRYNKSRMFGNTIFVPKTYKISGANKLTRVDTFVLLEKSSNQINTDKYNARNDKIFMDIMKSNNRDKAQHKNNKDQVVQYTDKFMDKNKLDKSDKFMDKNKSDKTDKFIDKNKLDKSDKSDKTDKFIDKNKLDKSDKSDKTDKFMDKNKLDKSDKSDKFMDKNKTDNFMDKNNHIYNSDVTLTPLNAPVRLRGGSYKNKSITDSENLYREKYIKYKNKFLNLRKNIK
jgi:hypothetical protein